VTVCRCVPVERTEKYNVCVPHTVEKEIQVQVCKMLPQTVTCKVPVYTNGCAGGCGCTSGCTPCK
jgi:hypothetical protein